MSDMPLLPRPRSLRATIASALAWGVLLTAAVLGMATWALWSNWARAEVSRNLGELASTIVLLIDPAVHQTLRPVIGSATYAHRLAEARISEARRRNSQITALTTLRWQVGSAAPQVILHSGRADFSIGPDGAVLGDLSPTLKTAFEFPYRVKVEPELRETGFGSTLSAYVPIVTVQGYLEGVLVVTILADQLSRMNGQILILILSLTTLITLAMTLWSWWMSAELSRPLRQLSDVMARVEALDLGGLTSPTSRILEIQKMNQAVDKMTRGLRSFKRFVPVEIVNNLLRTNVEAELGTTKQDLTILFTDLENFTSASEQLSTKDLDILLSSYFASVTETLDHHGATIDKFYGDSVMAFWNAPHYAPTHALRGALASLEICQNLEQLRLDWMSKGLPGLKVRLGLNTGRVMVGNVGLQERLSYTALGDAVNLASRLESLNKYYGTQLLVGETTLTAIRGQLSYRIVDKVAVKGKSKPTKIAELALEPRPHWAIYSSALEAYFAEEFQLALKWLECDDLADDGPSKILINRCRRFLARGLPTDWDGTWTMADK